MMHEYKSLILTWTFWFYRFLQVCYTDCLLVFFLFWKMYWLFWFCWCVGYNCRTWWPTAAII